MLFRSDERFKYNLPYFGINIDKETESIFKTSDIIEAGVDYKLLNKKRKEMFLVYPEIYNYISSYKSLYNSINYFGYNDLKFNEYYKNINSGSTLYNQLFRVEIPDLFDMTIDNWTDDNYFKHKNRKDYRKTNLYNLTYEITDESGNNVLLYTLEEVQFKLNELKKWLRNNILPLSTNIKDITGVSKALGNLYITADSSTNLKKTTNVDNLTCVNFLYTTTRNFNNNYLVNVNFYTNNDNNPEHFDLKIITFLKSKDNSQLYPQQYFKMVKYDLTSYNFVVNRNEDIETDNFIFIETTSYSSNGMLYKNSKLYNFSNGEKYNFDEKKNYVFVNNLLRFKDTGYVQNHENLYIIDNNNFYVIKLTDLKI